MSRSSRRSAPQRSSPRTATERAEARLRKSPYPAIRHVSCKFDRGSLMLRGRLSSFYHKQLAQEAVAGLDGVAQVVNQIEVAD